MFVWREKSGKNKIGIVLHHIFTISDFCRCCCFCVFVCFDFNHTCVLILFQSASSRLCFRFFFFFWSALECVIRTSQQPVSQWVLPHPHPHFPLPTKSLKQSTRRSGHIYLIKASSSCLTRLRKVCAHVHRAEWNAQPMTSCASSPATVLRCDNYDCSQTL